MTTHQLNSNSPSSSSSLILIVDDSSTVRSVVCKYLDTEYDTIQAKDGEEAWKLINKHSDISLVIADLHMPVMNGMQLLKEIRESDTPYIANLPVIMLTGHEDSEAAKQASYNMGASDFISKPFTEFDIRSRVRSYVQFNRNITLLEKSITTDLLTGLDNEQGFYKQAREAFSHNEQHGYDMSIIRLQMLNYMDILDEQGDKVAGQTIKIIAKRLTESLRKHEILAHLGNGHFAILLPMTKAFKAHIICMRLKGQIDNLIFQLDNLKLKTTVAVGLHSTENDHNSSIEQIIDRAENALAYSKDHRSCNIVRHDEITRDKDTDGDIDCTVTLAEAPALSLKLDSKDRARYLEAILSGNYEQIPPEHREALIEPSINFVRYATSETDISYKKISGS